MRYAVKDSTSNERDHMTHWIHRHRSLHRAVHRCARRVLFPAAALVALLALPACGDLTSPDQGRREGLIAIAPNVRLHYIDYGGSGQPLVLLAGLGNTAHVFETFAPLLTGRYH